MHFVSFIDHLICAEVGPEVISGSTRMKAGTATKLILNMISTGVMIRVGKTYGNLVRVPTPHDADGLLCVYGE